MTIEEIYAERALRCFGDVRWFAEPTWMGRSWVGFWWEDIYKGDWHGELIEMREAKRAPVYLSVAGMGDMR